MSQFDPTRPHHDPGPSSFSPTDRLPTAPYGPTPRPVAAPPSPAAPSRRWIVGGLIGGIVVVLIVLLVLVRSFRSAGQTRVGTFPVIVATSSMAPSLTATASLAPTRATTTCAQVAAFANAPPATTDSATFADVSFPAGTVGVSGGADGESGGYAHRFLMLCSPHIAAATLGAALNAALTPQGWARVTGAAADTDCTALCWQHSASDGPPRFISAGPATDAGGVVTYGLELTITPLTAGTSAISAAHPDFSADGSSKVDLHWVSASEVDLPVAALAAPVVVPSGGFAAINFDALRQTPGYQGIKLTQDELKNGSAIALQGNGGHLSKLLVTQSDASLLAFTWVTYAYGF